MTTKCHNSDADCCRSIGCIYPYSKQSPSAAVINTRHIDLQQSMSHSSTAGWTTSKQMTQSVHQSMGTLHFKRLIMCMIRNIGQANCRDRPLPCLFPSLSPLTVCLLYNPCLDTMPVTRQPTAECGKIACPLTMVFVSREAVN